MEKATIDDYMNMMDSLKSRESNSHHWVMVTGQQGYTHFSLAIINMYMPSSVPYTYVNFKKLPHIYYLSIGKKHGNLKVVLNTKYKSYRIYEGTTCVFTTYDDKVLTKQIKEVYEKQNT